MSRTSSDSGFTLIEALVSTVLIVFAVVSIAGMMAVGSNMQGESRSSSVSTGLAIAQMESLRTLPPSAASRQVGGSLTANVNNYFAVVGTTTIRWQVANGVACGNVSWGGPVPVNECSKTVVVRAFTNNDARATPATITGILWR